MAEAFDPSPPDTGPRLLTVAEVAEWLSISTRSVHRLAAGGLIPAVYLGPRLLRFEREKVERWIRESYSRPRPRRRRRPRPPAP